MDKKIGFRLLILQFIGTIDDYLL